MYVVLFHITFSFHAPRHCIFQVNHKLPTSQTPVKTHIKVNVFVYNSHWRCYSRRHNQHTYRSHLVNPLSPKSDQHQISVEWSRESGTWSQKMNLIDTSTNSRHFYWKRIGITNENLSIDIRVKTNGTVTALWFQGVALPNAQGRLFDSYAWNDLVKPDHFWMSSSGRGIDEDFCHGRQP